MKGKLLQINSLRNYFENHVPIRLFSLITASAITGKNYDTMGVDRRLLSRNTEAGGTITTPMVPWTDGGVFMATTLGVSTIAYLPYLWFHFLVLFISILYGYANWFCFQSKIQTEISS